MAAVIFDTEDHFVTGITDSAKNPKVAVAIWLGNMKRGTIAQEPRVILMQDERFALGKDEQTTFINCEGKMNLQVIICPFLFLKFIFSLFASEKIITTSQKTH
jgi:hypothetical protein